MNPVLYAEEYIDTLTGVRVITSWYFPRKIVNRTNIFELTGTHVELTCPHVREQFRK